MPFIPIIIIILVVVLILVLATNLKVVQQSKAYVIERLGAFHSVWGVGIHFKVPFLERVAKVVSLKEQVVDFPPQPVITKDNVTMQIDTVLYFQITDPKLYAYGVERPMSAIENLSVTTMRNIIGDMDLEQSGLNLAMKLIDISSHRQKDALCQCICFSSVQISSKIHVFLYISK